MSGKAEQLGEPFKPDGRVDWYCPENHDVAPLGEPGLIVVSGRDGLRMVAVKSREYRPIPYQQELGVYAADVVPVVHAVFDGDGRHSDTIVGTA